MPRLLLDGQQPHYLRSGHLVFARNTALWAAAFDLESLTLESEPVRVVDGVHRNGGLKFAVSAEGSLIYLPNQDIGSRMLVWVDREGREATLPVERAAFQRPSLSPDGARVAVEISGTTGPDNLWLYDTVRGTRTRLTFENNHTDPIWTPDGRRITYSDQSPRSVERVAWMPSDGSGPAEFLGSGDGNQNPHSWSPDGRFLAYYGRRSGVGQRDI